MQGERLERIWTKLKTAWNDFHRIMDGRVNYQCEGDSAFQLLSDTTPLVAILGFENKDNELIKVLEALITLQVSKPLHKHRHHTHCIRGLVCSSVLVRHSISSIAWV